MVIKMKILNPFFLVDALIYILSYEIEGVLPECFYDTRRYKFFLSEFTSVVYSFSLPQDSQHLELESITQPLQRKKDSPRPSE